MDLWNIKDLEPPPINSCKVTTKEIDIRLLDIALKDGINFFENQIHLHTEASVISRVSYRSKMKFRNSKDFKTVEQLSRTIRNYQHLEIPRILKTLLDSIPRNYKMNSTYMLTKNMMDYVLVRLQGVGKTLCRMLELCKVSSSLMQQRIRLGHFWKIAIVMLASTSRVFVIAKNVLKYVCELYSKLLPFSSSLGNAGVRWLPENYVFPNRLDEWLNINWLDLENNVIEIPDEERTIAYLKLTDSDDDDDVEFCNEYILVDDTILCEDFIPDQSVEIIDNLSESDDSSIEAVECLPEEEILDIGELINLSDLEPTKPKRKRKKKNNTQIIENIADKTPSRKRKRKTPNQFSNLNESVIHLNSPASSLASRPKKRKMSGNLSLTRLNNSTVSSPNPPKQKGKRKNNKNGSSCSNNSTIFPSNTPGRKNKRKSLKNIPKSNLSSPKRRNKKKKS